MVTVTSCATAPPSYWSTVRGLWCLLIWALFGPKHRCNHDNICVLEQGRSNVGKTQCGHNNWIPAFRSAVLILFNLDLHISNNSILFTLICFLSPVTSMNKFFLPHTRGVKQGLNVGGPCQKALYLACSKIVLAKCKIIIASTVQYWQLTWWVSEHRCIRTVMVMVRNTRKRTLF